MLCEYHFRTLTLYKQIFGSITEYKILDSRINTRFREISTVIFDEGIRSTKHWTYKMLARLIFPSLSLRCSYFSQVFFVLCNVWDCLTISPLMTLIIIVLYLIITMKSAILIIWITRHCLGLGYETIISVVYLAICWWSQTTRDINRIHLCLRNHWDTHFTLKIQLEMSKWWPYCSGPNVFLIGFRIFEITYYKFKHW